MPPLTIVESVHCSILSEKQIFIQLSNSEQELRVFSHVYENSEDFRLAYHLSTR